MIPENLSRNVSLTAKHSKEEDVFAAINYYDHVDV